MDVEWPASEGVTLLGKTPARADFIRINHGSASAIAFDEWLQRNLEELVLGGQRAGPPSRFLFVPGSAGVVPEADPLLMYRLIRWTLIWLPPHGLRTSPAIV